MKYNRTPVGGYVVALLLAGLAVSCSKEQLMEPALSTIPDAVALQIKAVDEANYYGEIVPLELAKQVAENETFQQLYLAGNKDQGTKNARLGSLKRTIRQAVSFKDKHNQPAVHVVTYNQGGFAILSAEKRAQAVLAMGDEDSVDVQHMPEVVKTWLGQEQASVEQQRTSPRGARIAAPSRGEDWGSLLASTGLSQAAKGARAMAPPPPDGPTPAPEPPCQQTNVTYFEPLVRSKLAQSGTGPFGTAHFNSYAPKLPTNHAVAGCWPVAAAAVMGFYEYPKQIKYQRPGFWQGSTWTILWQEMHPFSANLHTAELLANIGYGMKAEWGLNATGVYNQNAVAALKNVFGYKTVKLIGDPLEADIINEINGHRPVLLIGTEGKNPQDVSKHVWVCSGYRKAESTCSLNTYWLHMNWGWGGDWNGYYYGRSFYDDNKKKGYNNQTNVYAYNRAMVAIRPEASL
ncbi:C10 family peptidase [Larkinella sp. GY13]|jgi:hypothetical protein|uniref:C10 family peptidase n=1 Tax=Larkinella sp. GY13 TaxID=3453720 RepID=UPI003EEF3F67